MAFDYNQFNRRFGPWVSLAFGVVTVLVLRRGASYAPVAVGLLLVALWLMAVLAKLLDLAGEGRPEPRSRRLWRFAIRALVNGLYQNALFFLVPLWFASATWPSINLGFPLLLLAMAVFSCFEIRYTEWVVRRRPRRVAWSAVTLFAALVPVGPLLTSLPLRWYLAISAALATLAAVLIGERGWGAKRWWALASGGLAALLVTVGAPVLPPVPIQCVAAAAGTAVLDRRLVDPGEGFEAGSERVYAHFAVAAPERFRQGVRMHWFRDGHRVGQPFETEVVGGRRAGFRTWSFAPNPQPGRWTVELKTGSGQLIGRVSFRVKPVPPSPIPPATSE